MEKVHLRDVLNLVEYEKVREAMRQGIIARKRNRRVSVGENLTFLFENKDTVLFQIQEMVRTERIVEEGKIQDEVDSYNALIPGPSELSATLFIELPGLAQMSTEEVRNAVNRFQGLDRQGVWLSIGGKAIPAQFEEGHSKEEKLAAVHYLRFKVSPEAQAALSDDTQEAMILVDHPNYKAKAAIGENVRAELLRDLLSA